MDFTRTIQRGEAEDHIDPWFEGQPGIHRFPVRGRPRRVQEGDFMYLIHRRRIIGRFRYLYTETIDPGAAPIVGSTPFRTEGTHNVVVAVPGERAPGPIFRRGHQAIRYDAVPEWPA